MRRLALARCVNSGQGPSLEDSGMLDSSGLPATGQPCSLPSYQPAGHSGMCAHNGRFSGETITQSFPAVCSSVTVEKAVNKNYEPNWTHARPKSSSATHCSQCPRMGFESRSHTAPSSPLLQSHRTTQAPCSSHHALELTKQHSLDELRSTVHTMATSMEHSSSDVRDLSHRMVAMTQRMTDSVEENTQALSLLVEVVDKLQSLIGASKPPDQIHPSGLPKQPITTKTYKASSRPPTITPNVFVSRIRLSSSSSSSSASSSCSSSLNSYMEDVQTSHEPSCIQRGSSMNAGQSVLCNGSASKPNDDYGTIGCLSSKKKKSKMKK